MIAARRTGCPVKVLDDECHFVGGDEDARSRYYFKVGFKLDGRITAMQLRCYEAWVSETTTIKYTKAQDSQHIHYLRFCGLYKTVRPVLQAWLLDSQGDYPGMGARSRRIGGGSRTEIAQINDGVEGQGLAYVNRHIKKPQGFDTARDSCKEGE